MFLKIYKTRLLFFSILCLLSTHECYPSQFVLEKVHKVVLNQVSDKILTLNNHKLPFGSSFFFFSIPTYIISTNVWHKDFNVTNWDKKKPRALLQNFSSGVFIPLSAGYLWQLGTSNFFFGLGIGIDISQYKYTYDYSRSQLSRQQWEEINDALPIEKVKKIKEENKELSFFWKLINKFTPPCFKKKEEKKENEEEKEKEEENKEEKKEEEKKEEMKQKKRYYKLKDSIIGKGEEKSFDEYCHKLDNMLYEYCHQSNTKSNEDEDINDKNDNINNKTEDIDTRIKNNNLNVTSYKTKEIEAGVNSFISRYKMYLPEEEKKTNEQQQNIQNNINNGQNGINNNVNNNQVPPQNQVANNSKNICIGDIYKAFKDRNIKDEFRKKAEENANEKAEEKAKKEAKGNIDIKIEDNKELNEEEKKKIIENEKKTFIEEEKKKLLDEHYENLLEVLYRDYYNLFYPETHLLWSPVNKNLSFTLINFGPKVYITYLSNKIDPTYGWSLSFFFRGGLQILWDICGNANEAITLYEDYKNYKGDYRFTNLRFISPFIAAGFEVGYSIFQFIFEVKTFNYASILKKLRMQDAEDYYYANFKEKSYKNVINKDNDLYYRSNQQDDDEYTKYEDDDRISFFPVKSSIWKSLIFSISVNINSIS